MFKDFKKILMKFVQSYRHSTVPRWIILLADMSMFFVAFVLARALSRGSFFGAYQAVELCMATMLTLLSFLLFGTYRGIIRHSGLNDIFSIVVACIVPLALLWGSNYINNNWHVLPTDCILSYRESAMLYAMLICLMIMSRLAAQRIYNDYFRHHRIERRVVIYGAGAAGVITYNALIQDQIYEYKVVAFIDDDVMKLGQHLNGVPVLGYRTVLSPKFIKKKRVEQLIIAIPAIRLIQKRAISNKALDLGLVVKSVPHINTWIDGSFGVNQLESAKIEDLLERESIKLDNSNVRREVENKVVMVTGAAGSIGSEICRQLLKYDVAKVVMLDQAESPMYDLQFELRNTEPFCNALEKMEFVIANVKDKARMEEVFGLYHPQLIYHAAAYKHVPFMEENPYEAVYVNVFGTKNLADLAIKYGTEKFVMISTDKAVNPTNVMGATKRMAEIYTQSHSTEKTHFVTTRFGNVLGSNGSVIPLFKKQLAAGGPLTVTHKDITRYFMTIPEACSLVLEAGAIGMGSDIFVFDMGHPVKIYDLARKMIQLSGLKDIEIKEVGLRPGEKLYEELLATKENTIPTRHPKIMHAKVRQYSTADVDREYERLWDELETLDDMRIVAKMKEIVPEFVSNNSIYCQLDQAGDVGNA